MQTQVRVAFVLLLTLRFNILAPYLCITQRILIYFGRLNFTRNFYLLFFNSDSNLTQTQMLTLKLSPN